MQTRSKENFTYRNFHRKSFENITNALLTFFWLKQIPTSRKLDYSVTILRIIFLSTLLTLIYLLSLKLVQFVSCLESFSPEESQGCIGSTFAKIIGKNKIFLVMFHRIVEFRPLLFDTLYLSCSLPLYIFSFFI